MITNYTMKTNAGFYPTTSVVSHLRGMEFIVDRSLVKKMLID